MIWLLSFFSLFTFLNLWVMSRLRKIARGLSSGKSVSRLIAGWIIAMLLGLIVLALMPRLVRQDKQYLPKWFSATVYIWHILIVPVTAIILLVGELVGWLRDKLPRRHTPQPATSTASHELQFSRRKVLKMAAIAAPPLAAVSLGGISTSQIGQFRVKKYDLSLPGWPAGLDGLTMAIVADIHTGVFTSSKMLQDIVDTTNNLRPDLTLLPGDLINLSLTDLPTALDMVLKLDARYGIYMVQGNHDVIQNATIFNQQTLAKGVPLLLDQAITLRPRGIPVQLLGIEWMGKQKTSAANVARVAALRDPDLFPILMAHHPHAWDDAVAHGFPFVISGHTHGGQIMLTKNIGGGPLRFKYWTGLYQKPGSTLIVSNGVGNWFPLRVNAPAEILHITMHPSA